ncbi:tuftelin isoform X1 [Salmo salar]|uniref:Tuftelin-like isoform X1 n=1 Tax=Salmo salar TaxID=8030 RepID=A0A1S3PXB2_SALSA|nr:tuftelin-like isoform X1 [Salmo salar]XP_014032353.2 tuftelin-like isoform X1 [Salmo salar]XP_014032355.2 tuftelin-like isoform X1 [Salmo salar]
MLTDEVSQIQEVRYCLKTLREQMASRQNNNNKVQCLQEFPANGHKVSVTLPTNPAIVPNCKIVGTESETNIRENSEDSAKYRDVSKRLYAQLKESEKRHQEERDRMQDESDEFSRRLDEQSKHLQWVEGEAGERSQRVEELQRLLGGMELEGAVLRGKIAASEAELLQLRAAKEGVQEKKQRTEELEKELAVLKEKIHHLDDMLKSQQRKVRHMIEQLQNSRTVIQERERVIRDLEEKVAFLEAENTEMRDQIEYFLEGQKPASLPTKECKPNPQMIYR